jgi:uncharacterized protein YutE (UPF0331/DUF86 family)
LKAPLAPKYLLIAAVEAIADLCQHLLARTEGSACEGYVDCIAKAGAEGFIDLTCRSSWFRWTVSSARSRKP